MLLKVAVSVGWLLSVVTGTILENGRERPTNYPNTTISLSAYNFTTYPANATELSYKGRWDSKKVSWWA